MVSPSIQTCYSCVAAYCYCAITSSLYARQAKRGPAISAIAVERRRLPPVRLRAGRTPHALIGGRNARGTVQPRDLHHNRLCSLAAFASPPREVVVDLGASSARLVAKTDTAVVRLSTIWRSAHLRRHGICERGGTDVHSRAASSFSVDAHEPATVGATVASGSGPDALRAPRHRLLPALVDRVAGREVEGLQAPSAATDGRPQKDRRGRSAGAVELETLRQTICNRSRTAA